VERRVQRGHGEQERLVPPGREGALDDLAGQHLVAQLQLAERVRLAIRVGRDQVEALQQRDLQRADVLRHPGRLGAGLPAQRLLHRLGSSTKARNAVQAHCA